MVCGRFAYTTSIQVKLPFHGIVSGMKPLFIYNRNRSLIISSEVEPITVLKMT